MTFVHSSNLRSAFARRLSALYGKEVPAYKTLVEVSHEVNREVVSSMGPAAERLGSIERVSAERHGAIRVGTREELGQLARIFGAMGMHPVGFYNLRDAATPVPVVSTAFRPIAADELAKNPFRVFTSVLAVTDRRFFTDDQRRRLEAFLGARRLFRPELLALADRAESEQGLDREAAEVFLRLASESFALSQEPVDRAWYGELEKVSSVAADIGGVSTTHINHLTPRVLDIDMLYARMQDRGITMIDDIQGPPRWDGPDVLLRQTSFRALAEPRKFREADGRISTSSLRVRFGEVEARGIALTRHGRTLYDRMMAEVDAELAGVPRIQAPEAAARAWATEFPNSERELAVQDLGFFTYGACLDRPLDGKEVPADLITLLTERWLRAEPIVYEDFLPRSAAGIFQSNLTGEGSKDTLQDAINLDEDWMSESLGREVNDPTRLYESQRDTSLALALASLGSPVIP